MEDTADEAEEAEEETEDGDASREDGVMTGEAEEGW